MKEKRRLSKILRTWFYGRYPVVKQYDRVDCGPAALLSILRYHGGDSNLAYVRDLCNTKVDGTTMLGIITAATTLGFEAKGVCGDYDDLIKVKSPFIAHIIQESKYTHYVVVYTINERKLLLGDPARGLYRLSKEKFIKSWKEKAIIILNPKTVLYYKSTPPWFKWLWPYLMEHKSWIYQSIFLGILYTILSLVMALFVQKIIDLFIPSGDIRKIVISGILLSFIFSLKNLAGYYRQRFLITLNKRFSIKLNSDFITHILHLPKRFIDTHRTGDITTRINDTIRIQQGLLQLIGISLIDLMVIAGSLILLFTFSTYLALMIIVVLPFYASYLVLNMKHLSRKQNGVMQSYSEVQSAYINTIHCFDEILSFNAAYFYSEKNRITFYQYQDRLEILGLIRSKLYLIADQIGSMIMLILFITGSFWVIKGDLLLGQMMAAYSLAANILPSINRLVDGSISWQGASIAAQRLLDLMQIEKEKNTGATSYRSVNSIKISDGNFKWSERNFLFKELSILLERGKITALWGPIGSGKSTLMQILQRKYSLMTGDIVFGDKSIDEFDLYSYRGNVAVIPEQVKVINGTLAENILLGRQVEGVDSFKNLMIKYGFNNYLKKFEQGLFTILGENGHHLSGGELQMLGLIRALLNEPDVLIIDEGLNALDAETEMTVFREIEQYAQNHFVLISTHNLTTITRADYLYVLHNGKILQEGTPARLIREDGYFKRVWNMWKSKLNEYDLIAV